MKMELCDIPGVLSSGLLNSTKMRPMGRRFSIKIIDYIVEHFGSESTISYLNNIINFLIEGCKDSEIHVQNSAISTISLISKSYLTEEMFQLNPDIINIFFDPLIQFLKKETNLSTQTTAIAAISSAIDGMSMNLTIMNLNKFMNNLIPTMVNPSISETCRAVVIDSLRKIVVLIWTFLQETSFGSSPNMYDLKLKQFDIDDSDNNKIKNLENSIYEENLIPPITWKYICSVFNGILKELHPNYTNQSKNSNVRSASLSLLTEIMVCCFVAQAGALLAAHNSNIPLKKPIDGIKSCAQITINAITLGTKDKSPKVRDVAQYCMKRLQEANEAYIPDTHDLIYFSQNNLIDDKEQDYQNINNNFKQRNKRIINEEFFKNASDEIIIKHVSPPFNWKPIETNQSSIKDTDQQRLNSQNIKDNDEEFIQNNSENESIVENTLENYNESNFNTSSSDINTETEFINNNISKNSVNENEFLNNLQEISTNKSIYNHPFLLSHALANNTNNNSLPSPLYIVTQPPIIQGQMINSGISQTSDLQSNSQFNLKMSEKQSVLETKIEELTQELKKLALKQLELENVAHVLKMIAIHRVDSLEEKIKNLSISIKENFNIQNKEINSIINESEFKSDINNDISSENKKDINDFRKELCNKAKQILVENK